MKIVVYKDGTYTLSATYEDWEQENVLVVIETDHTPHNVIKGDK
jgi:hypothetical protein